MEVETLVTLSMESKENLDVTMEEETAIVTSAEPNDIKLTSDNNEEIINDRNKSPAKTSMEIDEDSQGIAVATQKKTSNVRLKAILDSDSEEDTRTSTPGRDKVDGTQEQSKEDNDTDDDSDATNFTIDLSPINETEKRTSNVRLKAILDSDSEEDTRTSTAGRDKVDGTQEQSKEDNDTDDDSDATNFTIDLSPIKETVKRTSNKRLTSILDSDSEEDTRISIPGRDKVDGTQEQSKEDNDTDDDSDATNFTIDLSPINETEKRTSNKRLTSILDSDSEEDTPTSTAGRDKVDGTQEQSKEDNDTDDDSDATNFTIDLSPIKETVKRTSNKRLTSILDSDSEDDTPTNTHGKDKLDSTKVQSKENNDSRKESDVEETNLTIDLSSSTETQKRTNTRRIAILDSDSEDDIPTKSHGKHRLVSTKVQSKENSDSEEESNVKEKTVTAVMSASNLEDRYKTLVDSESEDEISIIQQPHKEAGRKVDTKTPKSHQKKRTGSIRASKEEAMKQIHSETQRLLRESSVSLPYHVPRQRTLAEFLNRKKVINTLPKAPTMAAKLKMSSEIVNQVLEEKEREAKKFYASSDSEEEVQEVKEAQEISSISQVKEAEKPKIVLVETIPIEETQRLLKNVHDARNKIEILQQGDLDLGMPRKLFGQEKEEANATLCTSTSYVLQHPSVPRKLFDFSHEGEKSEKMEIEENDEGRNDDDIVKEVVAKLMSTVEIMMQEHREETEAPPDATAEAQAISETPHIGKEEVIKVLLKDEVTSMDKTIKANVTSKIEEGDTEAKNEGDKEKVTYSEVTPTCSLDIKNAPMVTPENSHIDHHKSRIDEVDLTNNTVTSVKSKLLSNLPQIQPRLRGSPGTMINLMQEVRPDRKGINQLIDRYFCKHSKVSKPTDNCNDVTVINIKETADGPMPVVETLPYKLPKTVVDSPELKKPGAKLVRLQQELKHQMAMKRDEEWKEKERQEKEDEEMFGENDSGDEKGPLIPDDGSVSEKCNNKDEEDVEEEEDEEDEDDLDDEMDDVYLKEKKRKSCAFGDDEAEVSGADDSDDDEEEDEDDENQDMELHLDEEGDEENSKDTIDAPKKRKLKRIIQAFDEDSCQSNTNDENMQNNLTRPDNLSSRRATDVDMFENDNGTDGWGSDNENCIPVAQQYVSNESRSQTSLSQQTESNILDLTPITQLTPLKNVTSSAAEGTSEQNELKLSLGPMLTQTPATQLFQVSPLKKVHELQKKLFIGHNDLSLPLMDSERSETPRKNSLEFNNEPNVSESQLLELCSGAFTSQPINMKELESKEASQKMTDSELTASCEVKSNEKSSGIGSLSSQLRILSSDEEEEDNIVKTKKHKKEGTRRKAKQLESSGDEDDASDDEGDVEEEIEESEQFVDYDSEENEVIVVPKKDIKSYAAGFVEDEAELSESDWDGSDDEDEQELDKLEVEDGDNEEIDEDEDAQKELGKFHMKRLLDEDQRDVRMLKELLFDDGDLHTDGAGRERRFRWKHLDKLGNDDNNRPVTDENDGSIDFADDENELQWRKMRHEREKFLAEQRKKNKDEDSEDDIEGSQVFQLGMKALQKSKSNQPKKDEESSDHITPTRIQHTITDLLDDDDYGAKSSKIQQILRKRSILARGEASLARLAVMAKKSESSHVSVKTGNFVFRTISREEGQSQMEQTKKKEQEIDLNSSRRKRKAFSDLNTRASKKPRGGISQRGQRKKPF